eukprot:g3378.t1
MGEPIQWVVICSPVSGKKQGKKVVETKLLPYWKEKMPSVNVKVVYTERAGHAVELAKELGNKETGIIAVGGDGTIREVLEGLGENKKDVHVACLSQGSLNLYAKSAGLPVGSKGAAKAIVDSIKAGRTRTASLMTWKKDDGTSVSNFESINIGFVSVVVQYAQDYRTKVGGSLRGIISGIRQCTSNPTKFSTHGTLKMWPKGGDESKVEPVIVEGPFFWIMITLRNPYNGALTKDMYVSWMTLSNFPGRGFMRSYFLPPPMGFTSGLAGIMDGNMNCEQIEFTKKKDDSSSLQFGCGR